MDCSSCIKYKFQTCIGNGLVGYHIPFHTILEQHLEKKNLMQELAREDKTQTTKQKVKASLNSNPTDKIPLAF